MTARQKRPPPVRRVLGVAAAWGLALALLPAAGRAQTGNDAETIGDVEVVLDGTLKAVRQRGAVRVGFREASVPFSYRSTLKEPIGYSVELCKVLVADIGEALHRELRIEWVPVTSANRIEMVRSGQVDVECGSTTNNAERRAQVAFSPTIFVAGTKLLVRKGGPVRGLRDLAGRKVAVTAGTTNEKTLRDLVARFKLDIQLLPQRDHEDGLKLLQQGAVDAVANDDVLLAGFLAQRGLRGSLEVVGDYLSYDPYGVMYRRDDPAMARVVNASFQRMAQDGEIHRQYRRWFMRKLPMGVSMDLPMSAQLEAIIQATQ